MIDVTQQINSVRRMVGTRVLEAGQARTVTISRTYAAAIEDVWDACTNAARRWTRRKAWRRQRRRRGGAS